MKASYNPTKMDYPELILARRDLKKELEHLKKSQSATTTQIAHTALQRAITEVRRIADIVIEQIELIDSKHYRQ